MTTGIALDALDAPEHGVRVNGMDRLGEGSPTLAEVFRQQGAGPPLQGRRTCPSGSVLTSSTNVKGYHMAANSEHYPPALERAAFIAAKPIWPAGREKEMNLQVGFRAIITVPGNQRVRLRLTASSLYRAFVNDTFCGHGPVRAAKGWFRIDEWDVTDRLHSGANLIAVEVVGYNVDTSYVLNQPAFLQAEVVAGDTVLAATGSHFDANITSRLQKTQRYNFNRAFTEAYRLSPRAEEWRTSVDAAHAAVACSVFPGKRYLPRRVPCPDFSRRAPLCLLTSGQVRSQTEPAKLWEPYDHNGNLAGFARTEWAIVPSIELQKLVTLPGAQRPRLLALNDPLDMPSNTFHLLDFGSSLTGFVGLRVVVTEACRLLLTFDEILTHGDVEWNRFSGILNILCYELAPGCYALESFEPYLVRYLKMCTVQGACSVETVWLREYVNPDVWRSQFACSDERLNWLFEMGRDLFAQNAMDAFLDCPSRERTSWLCDSLFTARCATYFSRDWSLNGNFFENYALPTDFADLGIPSGMIPMCYPSERFPGERFIPQWAMWFVLQLEEYSAQSGARARVDSLRSKVLALFEYLEKFRNSDGLLEKLEGWQLIGFSKANDFVQDVNYPTNMLYAGALSAAARLYGLPHMEAEAGRIRETVRLQSFDGVFFVDNAVRKNGTLELTANRSETCQYYAFFFDVATPEDYPSLWSTLTCAFGPARRQTQAYPEIHPSKMFIGNMLRAEILARHGRCQQALDDLRQWLFYRDHVPGVGTEAFEQLASYNWGFLSHVVHALYRDALGVRKLDCVNKVLDIRFHDLTLDWCEGHIHAPGGDRIALRWRKEGKSLVYSCVAPVDYSVHVTNESSLELRCLPWLPEIAAPKEERR